MTRVVLWGSALNPLSAAAAEFFRARGELALVVLPAGLPSSRRAGLANFLALAALALHRLARTALRRAGLRLPGPCASLGEFLAAHPEVRGLYVSRPLPAADAVLGLLPPGQGEPCFVSCIFPLRIPTRTAAPLRMINVHPGLLPENRGPNPYFWALALGHAESGVTYHQMTEEFDAGPVLLRTSFPVPPACSENRLERLSRDALAASLPRFWDGLADLWRDATPQGAGTAHPEPTPVARRRHGRRTVFSG